MYCAAVSGVSGRSCTIVDRAAVCEDNIAQEKHIGSQEDSRPKSRNSNGRSSHLVQKYLFSEKVSLSIEIAGGTREW